MPRRAVSRGFCSVKDCGRPELSKGMCDAHRRHVLRYGEPREIGKVGTRFRAARNQNCSISHCGREAVSSAGGSMCSAHNAHRAKGNDPQDYKLGALSKCTSPDCVVGGCKRSSNSQGVCYYHFALMKSKSIPTPEGLVVEYNEPCAFLDCKNLRRSKRGSPYCGTHARMIRLGEELRPLIGAMARGEVTCTVLDCKRPALIKMMCISHANRATHYGLTALQLGSIESKKACQNKGCNSVVDLCIDHDHETGTVRDLLCSNCNTSLGLLMEDPSRIEGLADYIKGHRVGGGVDVIAGD